MYDTYGKEILNEKLSLPLQDIKCQSYIENNVVLDNFETVYLKFDVWIRMFFDDGVLFIKEVLDEKETVIGYESKSGFIKAPLHDLKNFIPDVDKIINKKLIGFTISKEFELYLNFEGNNSLKIAQEVVALGYFGKTIVEVKG